MRIGTAQKSTRDIASHREQICTYSSRGSRPNNALCGHPRCKACRDIRFSNFQPTNLLASRYAAHANSCLLELTMAVPGAPAVGLATFSFVRVSVSVMSTKRESSFQFKLILFPK